MGDEEEVKTKQSNGTMEANGHVPNRKSDKRRSTKTVTIRLRSRVYIQTMSLLLCTVWFLLECLLCYAVIVVLLTPLLPFIAVFYMLKTAERLTVKITSNGIRLTAMDALWQQTCDKNRLVINALICVENRGIFDEGVKSFRQIILERMVNATNSKGELLYPRSRCCIQPGWFQYFFQEDPSFRIENHVFKWEGDVPRSKDELAAVVSKLSNEALPEGRPPWYFCCIPTNFGDNDMAVLCRIKHSFADGTSLIKFVNFHLSDAGTPQNLIKKFSSKGRSLLLAKALLIVPRYCLKLLLSLADRSILHGPNLSGVKKVAWHEAFELKLIKEIKTATGTTVNDVLMSCLSLAVRRYFQRKGVENPDDLIASVPVDVRSPASLMNCSFENKFSLVFPKLALATGDVLKQLYETKARMDQTKVSGAPLASAAVIFLGLELLPECVISKLYRFISQKSSCVISNVPGPQQLFSLQGCHVKYMVFWPPQKDNIGVGLSIYSYAGQVIVGVQGDVSVLSDPEIVVEEFGNAVNEMARRVLHADKPISNGSFPGPKGDANSACSH